MMDSLTPANMLKSYRENASDYMLDQAKQFRALSASDQREFLFFMMANMAVSFQASRALEQLQPTKQ